MSAEKWLVVIGAAGLAVPWFAVRLAEANRRIDSVLAQFNAETDAAAEETNRAPGTNAEAAPATETAVPIDRTSA